MSDDLEPYLTEYLARRESGESLTPEAFAREHPEREAELLRALAVLGETEALFPSTTSAPDTIGPYRVLGTIGRGGMGRVLRVAHVERPEPELALKLMNPVALVSPRKRERFARELSILRDLDLEGVVRVVDAEPEGEAPYLVMELVEGRSLASLVASARRAGSEVATPSGDGVGGVRATCDLLARLARITHALHERGVVHRDLKPSNVLLDASGAPVLVDFGLAAADDSETLTRTGDLLGTPSYMAPEQALGRPTDARTDVYALGAIAYELFALRPPHDGSDAAAILESIRTRPIAPIAGAPRGVRAVVERALSFRPRDRHATAAELAGEFERLAAGASPRARRSLGARVHEWRRTRPRTVVAVALVLVAALAGGMALLYEEPEDRAQALRHAIDRATMAWAAGDHEETRREAARVLALDPSNPTGGFLALAAEGVPQRDSDDPLIEALVTGSTAFRAGDLPSAKARFQEAIQLDPTSPLPVILLGQVATKLGEVSEQTAELRRALESQPESAALHGALGDALLKQSRYAEAAESFARASGLDDSRASFLTGLARSQYEAGEVDAAFETARRSLARFGARRGADFLRWAMAYQQRTAEARALLEERVEAGEESAQLFAFLGNSYDYEERIYEATGWYQRALELDPGHVATLQCLAHVHSGANRSTCEDCRRAFEEHPELYDPEQAEEYALRFLDRRRRKDLSAVDFVTTVAIRLGGSERIRATLEELRTEFDDDDFTAGVERALRKLDSSGDG